MQPLWAVRWIHKPGILYVLCYSTRRCDYRVLVLRTVWHAGTHPDSVSVQVRSDVQRLDVVVECAHHDSALELEGRGELAGLFGPVDRKDRELADRLGPGHRGVRVVYRRLHLRQQVGVTGEGRDVAGLAVYLDP